MTVPNSSIRLCILRSVLWFSVILSISVLGLVFLIEFGFLFVLQFLCMLVHRFTTLSHFIGHVPYRFGQSYRTSISFLLRHLDPDEEHLLTEAKKLGNRVHLPDQAGQIQETERNARENVREIKASA